MTLIKKLTGWLRNSTQKSPQPEKTTLTDGSPVTPDHRNLKPNGQQKAYVVLSAEERAKGFIRPVRRSYQHVGPPAPKNPLRDLTQNEKLRIGDDFVKYEEYPPNDERTAIGRFWTQEEIDKIGKGCGTVTTMSQEIAETYATRPTFYSGTFCCGCCEHLPVREFVWLHTDERVGS